jgi:hypothetical protein
METKRSPLQKHTPSKVSPPLASQIERSILAIASRDTTAKRMQTTALTGHANLWNGEEDEIEQEEGYDEAPSWKRARLTGGPLISEAATLDDDTQEQIQLAIRGLDSTFKRRRLIDISQQVALDDQDNIVIKREVFPSSMPACKCTRHTVHRTLEIADSRSTMEAKRGFHRWNHAQVRTVPTTRRRYTTQQGG